MPKEFIETVLINELGEIHSKFPYISFSTMAIGIEFLGKCLNSQIDWNYFASGVPKEDFERAIKELKSFEKYRPYLTSHKLWDSLRNGFSHSFVPKSTLTLSSKNEMAHLIEHHGKVNLRCEDLYNDFKNACLEVISKSFPADNKMSRSLLKVPEQTDGLYTPFSGRTY